MSPRELQVLIDWLPDTGALAACVAAEAATRPARGRKATLPVDHPLRHFGWGRDRHITADVVEGLLGVQYVVATAAPRKKGSPRPRKPKPYPRPGRDTPGAAGVRVPGFGGPDPSRLR